MFDTPVAPKAIMALSDFPGPEDEEPGRPFSQSNSRHKVLNSLLAKMEQDVHRGFAIKCLPRRGIPNESGVACAARLSAEIEAVSPSLIWCFGHRALKAVEQALGVRFYDVPELGSVCRVPFAGRTIEVVSLPSSRELEAHAEWRLGVWELLRGQLDRI